MSSDTTITLTGARELGEAFRGLGRRGVENASKRAIRKVTNILLKDVRAATPVLTGVLRRGWTTKVSGGTTVTGYVLVRNQTMTPSMGALRSVFGRKSVFTDAQRARQMRRFMKPKNPYFYARRVEDKSKQNAGFFSQTVRGKEAELIRSMTSALTQELRAEAIKRGFRTA